jgi:hypothetical protein
VPRGREAELHPLEAVADGRGALEVLTEAVERQFLSPGNRSLLRVETDPVALVRALAADLGARSG